MPSSLWYGHIEITFADPTTYRRQLEKKTRMLRVVQTALARDALLRKDANLAVIR
jgi:hypothetical protein